MNENNIDYIWETQKKTADCETYECPEYHPYDDFKRDPSGFYILIKVNFEFPRIEVAVCNKKHEIVRIFKGRRSQDIYNAIFKYEKEKNIIFFQEKTHIAYLGKELKKAELALVIGNSSYFQE